MQSTEAVFQEARLIPSELDCGGVDIVYSTSPWSPVAAVITRSIRLPSTVSPSVIDLRIPIPDLYAFATSATIAVSTCEVRETGNANKVVPFCERIDEVILALQATYFVDVRENAKQLLTNYSLCATPSALPERFEHTSLQMFLKHLLYYLRESPTEAVTRERDSLRRQLHDGYKSSALLLRLAHLHEGLGEYEEALHLLKIGEQMYPRFDWFQKKRNQVVRRMNR
jgi:hypothetical protein